MKYTLISFIFICGMLVRLEASEKVQKDPLEIQRSIYRLISNAESVEKKAHLIENLSEGLMSGSLAARQQTYRWLYQYDASLLTSDKIKQNVSTYLVEDNVRDSSAVILKGRLNLISESELLMLASADLDGLGEGRQYGTEAWGAILALAYRGKDEYALLAIEIVEAEKSLIKKATRLIHQLADTKHPIAISYIISDYLNSDERLPPVDERRSAVGGLISTRAAYQLSQVLPEFPIKRKYYSDYTLADILKCREWGKTYNLLGGIMPK